MRVVTWNIQRARPNPDGPSSIDRVTAALVGLEAEVCALQELDRRRRRSGGIDQPTVVAEALGGELVWAPTISGRDGEYGVGLVVRGTVVASERVELGGTREPRVLLIAEVEVAGRRWSVGCTHLSRNAPCAQQQLETVFGALAAHPGPWVLMGDLNLIAEEVLPWSSVAGYQLLDVGPTHSTRRRRVTRHIDHILLAETAAESAAVFRFDVSDHCAVRADLRVPGAT